MKDDKRLNSDLLDPGLLEIVGVDYPFAVRCAECITSRCSHRKSDADDERGECDRFTPLMNV